MISFKSLTYAIEIYDVSLSVFDVFSCHTLHVTLDMWLLICQYLHIILLFKAIYLSFVFGIILNLYLEGISLLVKNMFLPMVKTDIRLLFIIQDLQYTCHIALQKIFSKKVENINIYLCNVLLVRKHSFTIFFHLVKWTAPPPVPENCHNPNNNTTQSWVGHEKDFAHHPTTTTTTTTETQQQTPWPSG